MDAKARHQETKDTGTITKIIDEETVAVELDRDRGRLDWKIESIEPVT